MNITTETDPGAVFAVLTELNIAEVFTPTPPTRVCDGFLQIDFDAFLAGTNDNGKITLHLLTDCTKDEAWRFFETMRGPNIKHINPRLSFFGASDN